jgi:hypothetical protein
MSGYPQRDRRAPRDAPVRLETNGANGVWLWQVTINDHPVSVELSNETLRTVAWRASQNLSGRASQGGLAAKVRKS